MSLLGLLHRQPPREVIQAACEFYGISSHTLSSVHAEKIKALPENVWIVNVNKDTRAIVALEPGKKATAAPWYE